MKWRVVVGVLMAAVSSGAILYILRALRKIKQQE
jgi:hypothetical protein